MRSLSKDGHIFSKNLHSLREALRCEIPFEEGPWALALSVSHFPAFNVFF